ncbi:GNAT family N-acetyltransferase [Paracoccus sanguinis]|uniref:GNAT family N-acetyltransferase n=1 Tax=Paracoccus sanguinis TaxID=1545044 RepID=UPI00051FC023|nr:GNAT family N-acetyltransferase [Paracoccus sanguinis]KGJ20484.1 acetyltransferase [Paracoccus sanguinis]
MSHGVTENPAETRFELPLEGDAIAAAYYRLDEAGNVVLTHTEVPFEHSGQGLGTRLASGTFDLLRASGRKAVLRCSFMQRFYATHRDYGDVVVG